MKVDLYCILKRDENNFVPMNESIHIGEHWLSVQCSEMHYCIPRLNTSINDYTHFEVLMDIPDELITEEWEQHESFGVYSCVPKELIERTISELMKLT